MAEIKVVLYIDDCETSEHFAQIKEFNGQHLIGEVLISPEQINQLIALLIQFQAQEAGHD
jgi:hypothetical protein